MTDTIIHKIRFIAALSGRLLFPTEEEGYYEYWFDKSKYLMDYQDIYIYKRFDIEREILRNLGLISWYDKYGRILRRTDDTESWDEARYVLFGTTIQSTYNELERIIKYLVAESITLDIQVIPKHIYPNCEKDKLEKLNNPIITFICPSGKKTLCFNDCTVQKFKVKITQTNECINPAIIVGSNTYFVKIECLMEFIKLTRIIEFHIIL